MKNEKNPSFNSPSEALRWFRKNYFKAAGFALLMFTGPGIGRLLRDGNITRSVVLEELAFVVATFVFAHLVIVIGILVLGPLIDFIRGKKPDSIEHH